MTRALTFLVAMWCGLALILWLLFSFVHWSPNPSAWGEDARGIWALLIGIFGGMGSIGTAVTYGEGGFR